MLVFKVRKLHWRLSDHFRSW